MGRLLRSPLLMVWVEAVVRSGMGLVVLPMAVLMLPTAEMAIWLLFWSLMGLALLAASGLPPTLTRAAAYFAAGSRQLPTGFADDVPSALGDSPNWPAIHRLIATSGRIYHFVTPASALLLGTLGSISAWNLMALAGHPARLWLAFLGLVVWGCAQVQSDRWSALLQGLGCVAAAKRIECVSGLTRILFSAGMLLTGQGVLGATAGCTAASLLGWVLLRREVGRRIPDALSRPAYDGGLFRLLWPGVWRLGGMAWAAFFVYNGGTLLLAQISDADRVACYLLSLRLVLILQQAALAPAAAFVPRVIGALARKDAAEIRARTSQIVSLAVLIYASGAIGLILAGDLALEWLRPETRLVPSSMLSFLCVIYLLEMHQSIHTVLYVATNRVPFFWPAAISAAAIVGLGMLVAGPCGLYGIVLVQAVVQAAFNNWYPVRLSLGMTGWAFGDYLVSLPRAAVFMALALIKRRPAVEASPQDGGQMLTWQGI